MPANAIVPFVKDMHARVNIIKCRVSQKKRGAFVEL